MGKGPGHAGWSVSLHWQQFQSKWVAFSLRLRSCSQNGTDTDKQQTYSAKRGWHRLLRRQLLNRSLVKIWHAPAQIALPRSWPDRSSMKRLIRQGTCWLVCVSAPAAVCHLIQLGYFVTEAAQHLQNCRDTDTDKHSGYSVSLRVAGIREIFLDGRGQLVLEEGFQARREVLLVEDVSLFHLHLQAGEVGQVVHVPQVGLVDARIRPERTNLTFIVS